MNKGTLVTSFAVVHINIERLRKKNIENFDSHSVYLICDEYVLDLDCKPPKLLSLWSSENLLLNAYRKMQYGNPVKIYVDASYRYMVEKWGVLVIKVCGQNQRGRTVAYGVCSKEDGNAHEWIFKTLKKEVERLVNQLVLSSITQV